MASPTVEALEAAVAALTLRVTALEAAPPSVVVADERLNTLEDRFAEATATVKSPKTL